MKAICLFLLLWPLTATAQILFPGDANNDGRVNHLDVLALGLNFGHEGPPRLPQFQGNAWGPKPFLLWPGALPGTTTNTGFSDCDGNGVVDGEDVLALKFNYDSTQNSAQPPPLPYAPDTCFSCAQPRLIFSFDKDTATVKDTLRLHIFYEQPPGLPPTLSPLGVAFTLEFNEAYVKDSLTRVFFEPSANDLLFGAGATGFADSRFVPPGRVEFGAAGKGFPALSFSRELGQMQIIIEDMLVRDDTFWTDLKVDIIRGPMVNRLGQRMLYQVVSDEVALYDLFVNAPEAPAPFVARCYPSPVLETYWVESPEAPLTGITIYNSLGKLVTQISLPGQHRVEIPADRWPAGVYWVRLVAADKRAVTKKILKLARY